MRLDAWLEHWRREIALGGCLALAAGILIVSELGHRNLTHHYESAMESISTSARLDALSARLAAAETGQRDFLLTAKRGYLQPYLDAAAEIRWLLDRLRPHYAAHPDVDAGKVFAALAAAIGAKLGEIELTLDLIDRARPDRALEMFGSGIGQRTSDEIRFLIEDLSQREDTSTRTSTEGWHASLSLSRFGIALVATLDVLLVIALFYGSRRGGRVASERQNGLARDLRERTRALESLAARLREEAEAERTALARELHDELGALLTASKMDLAWVRARLGEEHAALHEKLACVMHHLDQVIGAKRRIVEGLRPSTLAHFGLATAARELAEEVAERAGWELELDLPAADPQLADDIQIALFRVLQESLTNAAKYAQARVVRVRLVCGAGQCRLEVEDNGCGFRPDEVRRDAHGLIGMRQRSEVRGGTLEIRSAPGKGTVVCASLPLKLGRPIETSQSRAPAGIGTPAHEAPGIAGA